MNKISAGTIARTIILALALINQILTAAGKPIINISDDNINMLISSGFTVITAIIAWWKNNSFTKKAIDADKYKKSLK
jgi:SPP1 family holin